MSQLFRKSALDKLSSPDQLDRAVTVTSPMSWLILAGLAIVLTAFVVWGFTGTIPTTFATIGVISSGVDTNSVYSDVSGTVIELAAHEGDVIPVDGLTAVIEDGAGIRHEIRSAQDCVVSGQTVKIGEHVNQGDKLFSLSTEPNEDVTVCYVKLDDAMNLKLGMDVTMAPFGVDMQKYGHMEGKIISIDAYPTSTDDMNKVLGTDNQMLAYFQLNVPTVAVTCSIEKDNDSKNGYYWSCPAGKELSIPVRALVNVTCVTERSKPVSKLIPGYGAEE